MVETLLQKELSDGSDLKLLKIIMNKVYAEAYERNVGDIQYVLELKTRDSRKNNRPMVGFGLDKKYFDQMYSLIGSEQDFLKINEFLYEINKPEDVSKLEEYLRSYKI